MTPRPKKPFTKPSGSNWFRLLAIDHTRTYTVEDFTATRKDEALQAVKDEKYSSAILCDRHNEVVGGKMSQTDIHQFRQLFEGEGATLSNV